MIKFEKEAFTKSLLFNPEEKPLQLGTKHQAILAANDLYHDEPPDFPCN